MTAKAKRTPTDAAKIRGAGQPLFLTDGTAVIIRFGFAELMEVEAAFGSIAKYADTLDGHVAGPIFTTVAKTVAIMLHRPVEAVAPMLDPHAVVAYAAVILESWEEAMPKKPLQAVEDPKGEPAPGAPGPTSTT